ncbi:MAG: di-heme oxidoredictase family protein [Planctomycetota bacterium]
MLQSFHGQVATAAALVVVTTAASAGTAPVQPKMGESLAGLTPDQIQRFLDGRVDYVTPLTVEKGLGPVFNKESCGNCHNNPVGGTGSQTVTRFGLQMKGTFDPLEEYGGSLLQQSAIDELCAETLPDGVYNVTQLRVTNGMLGYGLVEAIDDNDIYANEDPADNNGDGISGLAHRVIMLEDPKGPLRAGRFGWKAQLATILSFSGDAAQNEMGLSNRLLPFDNDPNGIFPPDLVDCDPVVDDPITGEDEADANGRHFIDRITDYQRFLAAPPQTPKSGMAGEALFMSAGCGDCHVPQFTTRDDPALEDAIRNKVIRPYSDFLLHNMGTGGDPIVQGDGVQGEVKTPPLWGVRVREPMLHNGGADDGTFAGRIAQVITHHASPGSEASASAAAYSALLPSEQTAIVAFLDSLGQAEFDGDGDDDVALDDFHGGPENTGFAPCFFGGGPYTADDDCAIHDVDQDGDADLDDFDAMMTVYTGPRRDCNGNGIVDLRDILDGTLTDADANGIADECEPTCAGDLDGSGVVDIVDMLDLLGEWGPCPASPAPCNADLDLNEQVDILDLLQLLASWGGC